MSKSPHRTKVATARKIKQPPLGGRLKVLFFRRGETRQTSNRLPEINLVGER